MPAPTQQPASVPAAVAPPEGVTFRTEAARRRFIPLANSVGAVEFTATDRRLGRRSSTALNLASLPETVSCGSGYLEVLFATDGGLVIDEIRTFGDEVVVIPIDIPD